MSKIKVHIKWQTAMSHSKKNNIDYFVFQAIENCHFYQITVLDDRLVCEIINGIDIRIQREVYMDNRIFLEEVRKLKKISKHFNEPPKNLRPMMTAIVEIAMETLAETEN